MRKEQFLFLYQNEYGALNESQKEGLLCLLSQFEQDNLITDYRWVAYMLATVKHECAGKWKPIEEYGKGAAKKYGAFDPVTNQAYYGRGYVQLTWKGNYQAMGKVCGVDLVANPALACEPKYAYRILSFGMRNGSFTGVGLKRFINEKQCDYKGARKIINGTDCAEKIAGYAVKLEAMLKLSILPQYASNYKEA